MTVDDDEIAFPFLEIDKLKKEVSALRAENSKLKEEVARLKRLRHAAKAYAESLPDVF